MYIDRSDLGCPIMPKRPIPNLPILPDPDVLEGREGATL